MTVQESKKDNGRVGSCSPTLAAKTKTRRGWGTQDGVGTSRGWSGFLLSHPSDKNKDVERMGQPAVGTGKTNLVRNPSHISPTPGDVGHRAGHVVEFSRRL